MLRACALFLQVVQDTRPVPGLLLICILKILYAASCLQPFGSGFWVAYEDELRVEFWQRCASVRLRVHKVRSNLFFMLLSLILPRRKHVTCRCVTFAFLNVRICRLVPASTRVTRLRSATSSLVFTAPFPRRHVRRNPNISKIRYPWAHFLPMAMRRPRNPRFEQV